MNQSLQFLVSHAEAFLFIGVFAEQIGLPLPAVPMLLAAGALIANGNLDFVPAIAITVVASVLADLIWFYLGRRGGGRLLRYFCKISLCDTASFAKTERLFTLHGMSAVVGAKFLPWLGFLIPPLAGAFGVKTRRFLWFDALGSLLYGIFYLALGYLFDREVGWVLEFLNRFGIGSLVLVTLLALAFVGYKYAHRRRELLPASVHRPAA